MFAGYHGGQRESVPDSTAVQAVGEQVVVCTFVEADQLAEPTSEPAAPQRTLAAGTAAVPLSTMVGAVAATAHFLGEDQPAQSTPEATGMRGRPNFALPYRQSRVRFLVATEPPPRRGISHQRGPCAPLEVAP